MSVVEDRMIEVMMDALRSSSRLREELTRSNNKLAAQVDDVTWMIFEIGRSMRESLLSWPETVSQQVAAECGVDADVVKVALDRRVREYLSTFSVPDPAMRMPGDSR